MSEPTNGLRATPATRTPNSKRARWVVRAVNPSLSKKSESWTKLISSLSFSMVIHAILLLILSLIYFDLPNNRVLESILSLVVSDEAPLSDKIEIDIQPPAESAAVFGDAFPEPLFDSVVDHEDLHESVTPNTVTLPGLDFSPKEKAVEPRESRTAASSKPAKVAKFVPKKGIPTDADMQNADHFVGRNPKTRFALLKRMGGTDASEAAVARGLVWLKNHQLPDGSWNFFHAHSPQCDCTMPGRNDNNPNAATAMALMAFLGAGQTHEEGQYQKEVQYGLDFLMANGLKVEKGICYYGHLTGTQTFYTHCLVTIALSEASAMTGDPRLRPAVTGAVDFLAATQDSGGGWRYFPGQPGDMSVVAWALMGLKSAQFSRIPVPQKVFKGVDRFLVSVATMRGTQFAYLPDRRDFPTPSMTAAGLLSRMYLDWEENKSQLTAGIQVLDEFGPDPSNMYYNYCATQVMHHWGGPEWDRWNLKMREHLIDTQIRQGHATGSWDVADRHGTAGGRLYMTSLALLTLEVYYRHLPLYQKDRVEIPLINEAAQVTKP